MSSGTRERESRPKGTADEDVPAAVTVRRVRSDTLLGEAGQLIIEHAGREYRLRQTSNGKLILTA